jgi:hypothetical protein
MNQQCGNKKRTVEYHQQCVKSYWANAQNALLLKRAIPLIFNSAAILIGFIPSEDPFLRVLRSRAVCLFNYEDRRNITAMDSRCQ